MIDFMSLVDLEHSMSFYILIIFFYLFSKTEIWSLDENDDAVTIKIAEPNLNVYGYSPELFIVDSDFCTNK